jgi:cytochrome c biogenesis protein
MEKEKNKIWSFLASVKLALFTLIILATASIVGTIIPQNQPMEQYSKSYGAGLARFLDILDFTNMYSSWWFLTLLAVFCINLIVCTIDRLPNVLRLITLNNLDTDLTRLDKMGSSLTVTTAASFNAAANRIKELMAAAGWTPQQTTRDDVQLFFSQKGAWSRLGPYVVHISILIIFIGAIIGTLFGYKASIYIPETSAVSRVYQFGSNKAIPLDFKLRCDKFTLSHYADGSPKEYRSDLTVLDLNDKEILSKSIVVNDPLDYGGLTFYQSSFQDMQDFLVTIENESTKARKSFSVPPAQQVPWIGTPVTFGILNVAGAGPMGQQLRYKIWLSDGNGEPSQFWINDGATANVKRLDTSYIFSAKQLYATGLQVTRDPGVWPVYIGCCLMILGLYIAFFLSHRRIWITVTPLAAGARIVIAGQSNKNKYGFEQEFEALTDRIKQDETIQPNN